MKYSEKCNMKYSEECKMIVKLSRKKNIPLSSLIGEYNDELLFRAIKTLKEVANDLVDNWHELSNVKRNIASANYNLMILVKLHDTGNEYYQCRLKKMTEEEGQAVSFSLQRLLKVLGCLADPECVKALSEKQATQDDAASTESNGEKTENASEDDDNMELSDPEPKFKPQDPR